MSAICGYGGIGRRASFRCWSSQGGAGSSPVTRTSSSDKKLNIWEHSSAGRASALQAEGHRFEPYCSHRCMIAPDNSHSTFVGCDFSLALCLFRYVYSTKVGTEKHTAGADLYGLRGGGVLKKTVRQNTTAEALRLRSLTS